MKLKKTSSLALAGMLAISMFGSATSTYALDNVAKEVKTEKVEKLKGVSEGDRYIVVYKDKAAKEKGKQKDKIKNKKHKINAEFKSNPNALALEIPKEDLKEYEDDPSVESVYIDELLEPVNTYDSLSPEPSESWHLDKHKALPFYQSGYSGQGVNVVVVDSGIDTDHPGFTDSLKGGTSVVSWSSNYEDMTGHGTGVAGSVAVKKEGGPLGIAPDVNLYVVKATVSATDGSAWTADLVEGIEWAVDNNMDAVNISFGNAGTQYGSVNTAMADAYEYANDNGTIVFTAAGNDGVDKAQNNCLHEFNYCSGAVNSSENLSSFSGTSYPGSDRVDFVSAGAWLLTADMNGSYLPQSGTSFSSPMSMGIFAVLKSSKPTATGKQIIQHMKDTATPLATGSYLGYGEGMLRLSPIVNLAPAYEIGYRQSHAATSYPQINGHIRIYTIVGNQALGLIDNYPIQGATVTHELHLKKTTGGTLRYKTLSGLTGADGRTTLETTFSTAYPKGNYIIKSRILHQGVTTSYEGYEFTIN